jgi:hypothetical protein
MINDTKLTPEKKKHLWRCKCGEWNYAPYIQTPDNVCVCDKCNLEIKWKDVAEKG